MRVKMLEDAQGSPDGAHVYPYEGGKVYEVGDDLGNAFIAEGVAEVSKAKQAAAPEENKQDAGPQEDK